MIFEKSSHLTASLRKQDGVLELDTETFKSFFLPADFMFELRWAAGYNRGGKLKKNKNKYESKTYTGRVSVRLADSCAD